MSMLKSTLYFKGRGTRAVVISVLSEINRYNKPKYCYFRMLEIFPAKESWLTEKQKCQQLLSKLDLSFERKAKIEMKDQKGGEKRVRH